MITTVTVYSVKMKLPELFLPTLIETYYIVINIYLNTKSQLTTTVTDLKHL